MAKKIRVRDVPELVGQLSPGQPDEYLDLGVSSLQSVEWVCSFGHTWTVAIKYRSKGRTGCPVCAGQTVLAGFNDLSSRKPELAQEFDDERNNIGSDQVLDGSKRKYWWVCAADSTHNWQATPYARGRGTGCPYCSGNKVSASNNLAAVSPDLISELDENANPEIDPTIISAGSSRKLAWKCDKGPDHRWNATVASRVAGKGCPYCTGQAISITNSLATQFPGLAAEWDYDRNSGTNPDSVTAGSKLIVWWKCAEGSDHQWKAEIKSRARGGRGCPFCAGKKASITNNLERFPSIATELHPELNNGVKPRDIVSGSSRKLWWLCPNGPDHLWKSTPNDRTARGDGCPFCRGLKASVTNSLASLHPELAREWHLTRNAPHRPNEFSEGSGKRFWWQCSEDPHHVWKASIESRALRGRGCPSCARHGYDPNAPGYLYLLRRDRTIEQQFGITNVPERRLQTHRRAGWEVLDVLGPSDGFWVQETEALISSFFRDLGVLYERRNEDRFVGYTETWDATTYQFLSLSSLLARVRDWEDARDKET